MDPTQRLAERLVAELSDGAPAAALGAALDECWAAAERMRALGVDSATLNTLIRAITAETAITVLNVLADADEWQLVDPDGAPLDGLHEAFLERIAPDAA